MSAEHMNSATKHNTGWTALMTSSTSTGHTIISTKHDTNIAIGGENRRFEIEKIHADESLIKNLPNLTDEYTPGQVFAEGGQGIVRSGCDRYLKRQVAIKTLKPEVADAENRSLFLQEAIITAQLCHPAVVPIYSLNSDDKNGLHLTMKLVRGMTLKSYLEKVALVYRRDGVEQYNERKNLFFRLEVFLRVCDALDYAHSRNIMHCDLKPENILIGEFHETYIMDWGIAREIIEPGYSPKTWKSPDTIAGTPRFLSPEAIHGEHTDQRADIYTMGLILFEIVSFREAYNGQSNEEVVSKIREGMLAQLNHRFDCKIDADLRAIIAKATAFDREKRYQHINELAADLRRYLAGEETTAKPYNIIRKNVAFFVRHRKMTISAISILIFLFLSIVTFNYVSAIHRSELAGKESAIIDDCLANSSDIATYIDSSMAASARYLSAFVSEYLFLDKINFQDNGSIKFYSTNDMQPTSQTAPPGMAYSSVYHRKINFDYFSWKTVDFSPLTAAQRNSIARIYAFHSACKNAFLSFLPESVLKKSNPEIMNYVCFGDTPFHSVLFGFEDGLYLCLPGRGYADSYDPRTRVWYKGALNIPPGEITWTKPYPGVTLEAGYLITCSMAMRTSEGKIQGVVGIDIRLKAILNYFRTHGNTGNFVIEKTLLDKNGKVIISTGNEFNEATSTGKEIDLDFRYTELFKIAKEKKFTAIRIFLPISDKIGNLINTECLCCVNYLPGRDWYYIEILNFDEALEN